MLAFLADVGCPTSAQFCFDGLQYIVPHQVFLSSFTIPAPPGDAFLARRFFPIDGEHIFLTRCPWLTSGGAIEDTEAACAMRADHSEVGVWRPLAAAHGGATDHSIKRHAEANHG